MHRQSVGVRVRLTVGVQNLKQVLPVHTTEQYLSDHQSLRLVRKFCVDQENDKRTENQLACVNGCRQWQRP